MARVPPDRKTSHEMSCYYCDKIKASQPAYVSVEAQYDLGSEAHHCAR